VSSGCGVVSSSEAFKRWPAVEIVAAPTSVESAMRIRGSFMSWASWPEPVASLTIELCCKGHVRLVFSSFAAGVTGARTSCALTGRATVSGDSSTLASRRGTETERQRLCMMD